MTQGCSKERVARPIQSTELVDFKSNRTFRWAVARRTLIYSDLHSPNTSNQKLAAATSGVWTTARIMVRAAALLSGRITW